MKMLEILGQTTQPAVDALEIMSKVDQFYGSAWNALVGILGVGLVLVGIIVPLIVPRLQQRSFDGAEGRLIESVFPIRRMSHCKPATGRGMPLAIPATILKSAGEVPLRSVS
jgi:hypothetical protein